MSQKEPKKRIVKGDVAKNLKALQAVAALPTLAKSPGGRPHTNETGELELTDQDFEVLSVLMSTNGNKALTARITGIDRKKLYRLLRADRVQRLMRFAKLRLSSIAEAAVACIEKAIIEDGDAEIAYKVLNGLGVLNKRAATSPGIPGKGKKATFEDWIDDDGRHKRQTLEECD